MDENSITKKLRALAKEMRAYKAVFEYLANRKTHRRTTDLYTLRNSAIKLSDKIDTRSVLQVFEEMHKLQIGELSNLPGRRPQFSWHYETKSVGEAALGQGKLKKVSAKQEFTSAISSNLRRYTIPLKDGREVTVEIPVYITAEDLERIQDFLKVLIREDVPD